MDDLLKENQSNYGTPGCDALETALEAAPHDSEQAAQTRLAPAVHGAPVPRGGELTQPELKPGELILGVYRLIDPPIESRMGRILHVRHTGWETDMAIKQPYADKFRTEAQREQFIAEATQWIKLGGYPHIVTCYYVREIDGVPSAFSEWMEGGSLKDWISRSYRKAPLIIGIGRLRLLRRILDIAIQVARGLSYAHNQGLIHLDVKPGNILLSGSGEVKLADFGISAVAGGAYYVDPTGFRGATSGDGSTPVDGDAADAGRGEALHGISGNPRRSCYGTPAYRSPEQKNGEPPDVRMDVFSFGVTLLELFTGGIYWPEGSVVGSLLENYFEKNLRVAMPVEIRQLVRECLCESANKRPENFRVIGERLLKIYEGMMNAPYPGEPDYAADTADGLNNRALSLLDLGRPSDALSCWDEALSLEYNHAESLYNSLLYRVKQGEITGAQAAGEFCRLNPKEALALALAAEDKKISADDEGGAGSIPAERRGRLSAYELCRVRSVRDLLEYEKLFDDSFRRAAEHCSAGETDEAAAAAEHCISIPGYEQNSAAIRLLQHVSRNLAKTGLRSIALDIATTTKHWTQSGVQYTDMQGAKCSTAPQKFQDAAHVLRERFETPATAEGERFKTPVLPEIARQPEESVLEAMRAKAITLLEEWKNAQSDVYSEYFYWLSAPLLSGDGRRTVFRSLKREERDSPAQAAIEDSYWHEVMVFDTRTGDLLCCYDTYKKIAYDFQDYDCRVLPDSRGERLLVLADGLHIIEIESGMKRRLLEPQKIRYASFFSDEKLVFCFDDYGRAAVTDSATGECWNRFSVVRSGIKAAPMIKSVSLTNDDSFTVSYEDGSAEDWLFLWEWE